MSNESDKPKAKKVILKKEGGPNHVGQLREMVWGPKNTSNEDLSPEEMLERIKNRGYTP